MADSSTYVSGKVLAGLKGVRERLSVYIGSTGVLSEGRMPRALSQMAQEAVSNALDEHIAGYGDDVLVTIHTDGSLSVADHGRGLPKGPDDSFQNVIDMMTKMHGSGKFDESAYAALGVAGMNGLGMKAVNAGSKWLDIVATCSASTMKDGQQIPTGKLERYHIRFKQDEVLETEQLPVGDTETGTVVTFMPDDGPTSDDNPRPVLESIEWLPDELATRLEPSAFLMPGLKMTLVDERSGQTQSWCYANGLVDYLKQLTDSSNSVISGEIEDTIDDLPFQLRYAMQWQDSIGSDILSFANGVPTPDGGPHVNGFINSLTATVNEFASQRKLLSSAATSADVLEGLTAVFEVRIPASIVDFEGQTKEKLATVQAKAAVEQLLQRSFAAWLFEHEQDGTKIVEQVKNSAAARNAAIKARKTTLAARKASNTSKLNSTVSSKLRAASSKHPEECELYITEGDSASNIGRNPKTQAVFPIRGKILNVMKSDLATAFKNTEISTIVQVLGAGVLDDFDVTKLQYNKIIMAHDFDADGFHIGSLLCALFYRLMPDLIRDGHLYQVQAPLYKAVKYINGEPDVVTVYSETEMAQRRSELSDRVISRFKGLGEMSIDEAHEALADPETRHLKQITMADARQAALALKRMMGSDSAFRREWVRNLTVSQ